MKRIASQDFHPEVPSYGEAPVSAIEQANRALLAGGMHVLNIETLFSYCDGHATEIGIRVWYLQHDESCQV